MNGCMNCYRKSTLTATGFSATIPANGTLTFGTTTKITGNAIEMGENNTTINLKRAGLYEISVSATATGSADNEFVSMQLNRNNVAITDGFASFKPATAENNAESMSFTTIVEVDNTTAQNGKPFIPISITNTGQQADYTFSRITVVKIA